VAVVPFHPRHALAGTVRRPIAPAALALVLTVPALDLFHVLLGGETLWQVSTGACFVACAGLLLAWAMGDPRVALAGSAFAVSLLFRVAGLESATVWSLLGIVALGSTAVFNARRGSDDLLREVLVQAPRDEADDVSEPVLRRVA
jgi:hypothetical protein